MDEELMQLIADRVLAETAPGAGVKADSPAAAGDADFFLPEWHELGLEPPAPEFLADGDAGLCFAGLFDDAGLPPLAAEPQWQPAPGAKRRAAAAAYTAPQPPKRQQLEPAFAGDLCLPGLGLPCYVPVGSPPAACGSSDQSSFASHDTPPMAHCARAASVDSFGGGDSAHSSAGAASRQPPEAGLSAEHHLEQIQRHVRAAIEALRAGRFERTRNVVAWAHDLKNKAVSELKREAEAAVEADRSRDRDAAQQQRAAGRRPAGSTKRVEQFRKNMRRWMIGTQAHQVGVDWMVYARLEHLTAIARYLLGEALPADPASPTAVAESVCKHLGQELPHEFVDAQLGEPEPGKRYAIGPQLAALLQAAQPRRTAALAFTMPPDGAGPETAAWLAQLRALFPCKPAPRHRAPKH